jgi:DNA-binding SARP family transcriptional activator
MDTFWPAASPEAARNNLHVALSGVRQALRAASPVSLLQRRHDTYRLGADLVWVDAEEFEQRCAEGRRADRVGDIAAAGRCYSAADRLYAGDLLAEDPYLDWASQRREALRLSYSTCSVGLSSSTPQPEIMTARSWWPAEPSSSPRTTRRFIAS